MNGYQCLYSLGQRQWPWAHGATRRGRRDRAHHGEASIDIAWSDDLMHWHWPGNPTGHRAAVTKPG